MSKKTDLGALVAARKIGENVKYIPKKPDIFIIKKEEIKMANLKICDCCGDEELQGTVKFDYFVDMSVELAPYKCLCGTCNNAIYNFLRRRELESKFQGEG